MKLLLLTCFLQFRHAIIVGVGGQKIRWGGSTDVVLYKQGDPIKIVCMVLETQVKPDITITKEIAKARYDVVINDKISQAYSIVQRYKATFNYNQGNKSASLIVEIENAQGYDGGILYCASGKNESTPLEFHIASKLRYEISASNGETEEKLKPLSNGQTISDLDLSNLQCTIIVDITSARPVMKFLVNEIDVTSKFILIINSMDVATTTLPPIYNRTYTLINIDKSFILKPSNMFKCQAYMEQFEMNKKFFIFIVTSDKMPGPTSKPGLSQSTTYAIFFTIIAILNIAAGFIIAVKCQLLKKIRKFLGAKKIKSRILVNDVTTRTKESTRL